MSEVPLQQAGFVGPAVAGVLPHMRYGRVARNAEMRQPRERGERERQQVTTTGSYERGTPVGGTYSR